MSRIHPHRTLGASDPIERIEEGSDTVRYANVRLLAPGIWTDEASRKPTDYTVEGMRNLELEWDESKYNGPPINVQHDTDDPGDPADSSVAGYVDPDSVHVDDDGLYGDYVLNVDKGAGQFVDENYQEALETNGRKGFGGPSVELSSVTTQEVGGVLELTGGKFVGVGHVRDPASLDVDAGNEAARRGVALSSGSTDALIMEQTDSSMTVQKLRKALSESGFDVEGKEDSELKALAETLELEEDDEDDESEESEEGEDTEEEEEDVEAEEEEESEEEDEEPELSLEEMQAEVEEMREAMQELERREKELEDEVERMKEGYEDDETEQELAAVKEDLEETQKELSELKEQEKPPKSLAAGTAEGDEDDEWLDATTTFGSDTTL